MSAKLIVAQKLQAACEQFAELYDTCNALHNEYTDATVKEGAFVDADLTSLPKSPTAVSLVSFVTFLDQWNNFIGNAAVTTGDYKTTLETFRSS